MKIQDAKKAYAAQMDTLWTRKRDLSQALKNCQQGGAPNVDRVEISRELSAVDAQYNEAQGVMESIIERETAIHNAEVAKQQGNALSKAAVRCVRKGVQRFMQYAVAFLEGIITFISP